MSDYVHQPHLHKQAACFLAGCFVTAVPSAPGSQPSSADLTPTLQSSPWQSAAVHSLAWRSCCYCGKAVQQLNMTLLRLIGG